MDGKNIYEGLLLKSTGQLPRARSPRGMTRITENVYLGNYKDAMGIAASGVAFRYVLNLTTERYTLKNQPHVTVVHIPLVDDESSDVRKYFDEVVAFLDRCERQCSPVLVHCVAGVNRSGVMIMAYLLHRRPRSVSPFVYFLYVYHGLREQRGAFVENPSFRRQLIEHYVLARGDDKKK
ncbi:tyrosine kinase/phosphatase [Squirrelpox virus]|uniref:Tyrosine kinase/phosphatase n=1 Tax=Squirrelpox virus TaxID=240426 RepID=U3UBD0_9POXV|nr:tyrosine kinase/phosphatase [Squirrelpox virus]CCD83248.1 tyrosine kinase/phosphatase [Squirrelpox virus]